MSDTQAALAHVLAHPDDDGARLAYAKALTATGDARDAARARFIEVQIKLAGRIDPATRRALVAEECELVKKHRKAWSQPVVDVAGGKHHVEWRFARGFIDSFTTQVTEPVLTALPKLFAVEPVQRLCLRGVGPAHFATVRAQGVLAKLRTLELFGPIGSLAVRTLAGDPALANVRALHFANAGANDDDWAALFASPHLRVHTIGLGYKNGAGARTIEALTQSSAPLEALYIPGGAIDDAALAKLIAAPVAATLRALGLRGNDITDEGARLLLRPGVLPRIGRLDIEANDISLDVAEALRARYGPAVHVETDKTKPRRRQRDREPVVEIVGDAPVLRGAQRYLYEWLAAVVDAAWSADLWLMDGFARPESAACARCRLETSHPAIGVDGRFVADCASCRGGGVTLGPARAWSDFGDDALRTLCSRLARDGALLSPSECATAADLLTEVVERVDERWQETTRDVIDGLRATWSAGATLKRRTRAA